MVDPRQNAVGALFAEDDAAAGAIDGLIAAGARPGGWRCGTGWQRFRPSAVKTVSHERFSSEASTRIGPSIFAGALGEGVLVVLAGAEATADRVGVLLRARADMGLANVSGVEHLIALRAEQLTVDKAVVVTSEVTVRTEVISEVKTFEVELKREEFVIERMSMGDEGAETRTVVSEEIAVHTEQFVDVAHIEETVKHEVLRVDRREVG